MAKKGTEGRQEPLPEDTNEGAGYGDNTLPEPVNEGGDEGAARAAATPPEEAAAGEPEALPETNNDKRKALIERLKAKQRRQPQEGDEPPPVEAGQDGGQEPPAAETPAAEEPPPADQKRFKLRVDHQDVEVTEEELQRAAQIGLAKQNRLEDLNARMTELNSLRELTRAELAELRQIKDTLAKGDSAAHPSADDPAGGKTRAAPTSDAGQVDKQRLKDVLEKVRYGDDDEGIEALASLIQERQPEAAALSPEEIASQAEQLVLQRLQHQAAIADTATSWQENHPEICADQGLTSLTAMQIHRLAVEELAALGVKQDDLRRAAADPGLAYQWHHGFRTEFAKQGRRHGLSDANALGERAAQFVEENYVVKRAAEPPAATETPPPPPPQTGNRSARVNEKRDLQGSQPRRANVVGRAPGTPIKMTRAQIINRAREDRKYTVLGE